MNCLFNLWPFANLRAVLS